ncbi:hypothetical protein [Methanocella arvoryzae]|uniref:Uncharacterized protein n=1 Tax=Methanocella arvoryzae (strain DSM 22066 / NBRC 105507 / MRE50) TaxID=351160 RepID=Q0W6N8_METAR|nr:hypothetical protein [Methanocella arvoryzae]CAJ35955.1 hypothetical protein RCIX539 [Methanocella arvoryzae MRE50]
MKLPEWDDLSSLEKGALTMATIIVGALLVVTGLYCLMIVSMVYWGTTNQIPGKYTYTVTIQDLNSCTSDGGVEILVPIPYVNGQQVFSDEELNDTCRDWRCAVKMTDYGKMLSITCPNETLYNFGVRYTKNANNLIPASSARDVFPGPYTGTISQNSALFDRELTAYESSTRHAPAYKNWINYSDPDGWAIGNTTVAINGKIWKPEKRKSIVVDMYFEALGPVPDGCQPPQYLFCSYAEMEQTNNSTYSPVVLSYGPF